MVDGFHLKEVLFPNRARVVTGPLSEGAFRGGLVRQDFALNRDLSVGRDGETGKLSRDDLDGFSAHSSRPPILGLTIGDRLRARQEEERIMPDADYHGAGFPFLEVFGAMDPPILARRDVADKMVPIQHHSTVDAEIDPITVGVARDRDAAGADVAAPILGVPLRSGKLEQIYLVSLEDIFRDRSVLHPQGRNRLHGDMFLAPHIHVLNFGEPQGKAGRHGNPAKRVEGVGQDPKTARVILDLVEEKGGRPGPPSGKVGDGTDLLIPMSAVQPLQLAHPLNPLQPLAQITVTHGPPLFLKILRVSKLWLSALAPGRLPIVEKSRGIPFELLRSGRRFLC